MEHSPREVIAMPVRYRKKTAQHLLSTTARQHLRAVEPEIKGCPIMAEQKEWNYNDFVEHVLEVIAILRLSDKRKNNRQEG
jgi:hypothetical protein